MENKQFEALIEEYNQANNDAKALADKAKKLGEAVKAELVLRNIDKFVTESNLETKLVESTTMSFDNDMLVTWLIANGKTHLVKTMPVIDVVKAEINNNLIKKESLTNILKESKVNKLYVKQLKD